jgi:hypothetical protein
MEISLPRFKSEYERPVVERLNRFYDFYRRQLEKRANRAKTELDVTYTVAYDGDGLLSVLVDRVENGLATRSADNWRTADATPLLRLFPRKRDRAVLRECETQAERRGYPLKAVRRFFEPEQCHFAAQDRLCLFYQPGTLAPAEEGPVAFMLAREPEV